MKMSKSKNKRIDKESPDLLKESVERLKELFPGIVSEGKIDLSRLREVLGDEVDDRPERYSFTWAGKRDAVRMLQVPSRATLVPVPEESVNFEETNNIFIEGENLEVLKLLYKSYAGRVKMIYIDPPYNTGKDFIYPDNFADPLDTYLKLTEQKDSEGNLLTSNPETSGRFHSAWLSMMYPRLFVARQLLREDGVIFISIDDNEVSNLRLLMNEIFGEENFVANIVWQKIHSTKNDAKHLSGDHEYILLYAKNIMECSIKLLPRTEEMNKRYQNPDNDPRGPWASGDLVANEERKDGYYEVVSPLTGKVFNVPMGKHWVYSQSNMQKYVREGRIWFGKDGNAFPRLKRYLSEVQQGKKADTLWLCDEVGHNQEAKREVKAIFDDKSFFDTPKPVRLIKQMIELNDGSESIILDFFSGSASTAHAVLELNKQDGGKRKFVMVQIPETCSPESEAFKNGYKTIAEISKERIRRVIKNLKKEKQPKLDFKKNFVDEDLGFKVYKLAESNYKPWKGVEKRNGMDYSETMEMFTDPLAKGWKPINVIYEVALKEGYSLNIKIDEIKEVKGNKAYKVTDPEKGQSFMICLDNELKQMPIKALNLKKDDLFICRDAALTDGLAANLALQCKLKTF